MFLFQLLLSQFPANHQHKEQRVSEITSSSGKQMNIRRERDKEREGEKGREKNACTPLCLQLGYSVLGYKFYIPWLDLRVCALNCYVALFKQLAKASESIQSYHFLID